MDHQASDGDQNPKQPHDGSFATGRCNLRKLTMDQTAAITAVMRLFAEEDLAKGVPPNQRMRCDRCEMPKPLPGFVGYSTYKLCNDCSIEYELARAEGEVSTIEEFIPSGKIISLNSRRRSEKQRRLPSSLA